MSQDRDPAADRDRVEQLLDEVVALPGAEQEAAFGALLAQHPDHANELRARYALFQRLAALAPDDGPNDGPNAAPNQRAGHRQHDGKGPARRQQFGEYELVRELGSIRTLAKGEVELKPRGGALEAVKKEEAVARVIDKVREALARLA